MPLKITQKRHKHFWKNNKINIKNGRLLYNIDRVEEAIMYPVIESFNKNLHYIYKTFFESSMHPVSAILYVKNYLQNHGKVKVLSEILGNEAYYQWSSEGKTFIIEVEAIGTYFLTTSAFSNVDIVVFSPVPLLSSPSLFNFLKFIKYTYKKFKEKFKQEEKESPYIYFRIYVKDTPQMNGMMYRLRIYREYEKNYPIVNYLPIKDQLKTFEEKLRQTFKRNSPTDARVIILEGPPGTGKTYYIQRILSIIGSTKKPIIKYIIGEAAMNIRFIDLIPPRELEEKMILIMEDVEPLIFSKVNNRSIHLSRLLNYSDGLLKLNTFFILTTNLGIDEIDPALLRDGRLFGYLRFGNFKKEQDIIEWCRFHKIDEEKALRLLSEKKEISLAELYSLARNEKKVTKQQKISIGFNNL